MMELMGEGERKEEPPLPPDYVSLAQLQERWLQKQAEKKLKEKQEEEEKRERDARAQQEKNRNQNRKGMKINGRARIEGAFVREADLIQDKGKGKEIVAGGNRNLGENDRKREVNRGRKSGFIRAPAVEGGGGGGGIEQICSLSVVETLPINGVKEEIVDVKRANLRGGFIRAPAVEGGGGGGGIEQICSLSVVEILPINGVKEEILDVKRADLRGGLRGNGKNSGSQRVNELDKSEMGLDFEKKKKVEVESNRGKNQRGRTIWRERSGGSAISEGNRVDHEMEKKVEDEVSEISLEISSLSVGDRIGGRNRKSEKKGVEHRVEGEKASREVLAVEGVRIGRKPGNKGFHKNKNRPRMDRVKEEGSSDNKVAMEIEKKVDNEVLDEKRVENKGVVEGYRRNSRPRIQGESSNGNEVDEEGAKIGNNRPIVKGYYRTKEKRRRDFGRETRREIFHRREKVNSGENGMVWVRKEEKL